LPKDEPTAVNPPFGARIDYFLARPAAQPVLLTILDARGQPVRRYSSADSPAKYDPAKAGIAAEWSSNPSVLVSTPGLHRFIWPLRYPALPALADGDPYANGVSAPPGRYTLELTVDGHSYRQALTVVPDPRVKLPGDAYQQQFAFARDVEQAQARLASAQSETKQLHAGLNAAREQTDPKLGAAVAALDAKLVDIAGIVDTPNPGNARAMPPTSTRSFAFLDDTLGKYSGAADDADAAPSPDARSGFAALVPKLDQSLADWQRLKSEDLIALNVQLRAAGKKELTTAPAPAK
jgi:hypothetical protein